MDGIIIILGSPNDSHGTLSTIAQERLTQGIKEYTSHPGYAILLTGGFGQHFNTTDKPHAYYAKQFLLKAGIPEEEILEFIESSSTMEDAVFSKPIISKYNAAHIIIVTSDFHLERAKACFGMASPGTTFSFSGSKTSASREQMDALLAHERHMMKLLMDEGL